MKKEIFSLTHEVFKFIGLVSFAIALIHLLVK